MLTERRAEGDTGQSSGCILIVDDVADNRTVLARRFQKRGFTVSEAPSGQAALEAIAAQTFDLVLLDVMMPDMDGMQVLARIREQHSDLSLPVIMVTGRAESQNIVEALSAGANDYIVKPVDFAVALLRVSTQIGRRRAEEQLRQANEALSLANSDLEARIDERTRELVASNAQLRAAIEEAKAASQAKDDFLSNMSHELRTPLNGLLPMVSLLEQSELTEAQRQMTDLIKSSADAMFDLVSDLLDTLDLTAREIQLNPAKFELGEMIRDASRRSAARAEAKGLTFHLDIAKDAAGPVMTDAHRLKQVIGKLTDNAVKFTEKGEIRLALTRPVPDQVAIEVSDTGMGFEDAISERLFRPFEQSDGSMTRRFGGSGVGLAISRGLVELMGGTISAKGKPGVGAVFRVSLPLPALA